MRRAIPEEAIIIGALGPFFAFVVLLLWWPGVFRPILELPPAKVLTAIGLLFNVVGSVAVVVDLLTGDALYLKRHQALLDILFLSFFALPFLYIIMQAAVFNSGVALLAALIFFFLGGLTVRFGSEWFSKDVLRRYGQARAMAFLGVFLFIAGFVCQFVAVFLA